MSIFDEAKEVSATEAPTEDDQEELDDVVLSDLSPKELAQKKAENLKKFGVKAKADGRTLTIKSWSITPPKTKDGEGAEVSPKESSDGSRKFYSGKLALHFEEDELVEYYPSIKYFVNVDKDGKTTINKSVKIYRTGDNAINKIFDLAVPLMKKAKEEISDKEFLDWLVGRKVKIKTSSGVYMKKEWFRNDIEKIF